MVYHHGVSTVCTPLVERAKFNLGRQGQASRDRNQPNRSRTKRASLPDQFLSRAVTLEREMGGWNRLLEDDRLPRHKEMLRIRYASVLKRHIQTMERALEVLES